MLVTGRTALTVSAASERHATEGDIDGIGDPPCRWWCSMASQRLAAETMDDQTGRTP
jgi:hypothetical protein